MDALVDQARTDADMTNSKCAYRGSDRRPNSSVGCSSRS